MPSRTAELQDRLRWLGFDPGPSDAIYGELTEDAVFDCLDKHTPPPPVPTGIVPASWMPACKMIRVVSHWSAGAWKASTHDLDYYHLMIEDDGRLVRGVYSISDNVSTSDGRYAPHCKSLNTGSIGVSLCAMAGATENPFSTGKYPITSVQWNVLSSVVAELCNAYSIPVTRETVLSHAEVQKTLGVAQSGKIDFMWIPGMTKMGDAIAIGDQFRKDVQAKL
jgi:hypothetical protein